MATEKLQIVIDAVFKGKGGIEQAGRELKELDKEARKASEGTRYMAERVKGHLTGLTAGFAAAALVVRETYQIIGEGAELEKAAGQFDNLTSSIGTTSNSMLTSLRTATQGMMSDAELIASANQIISLGLGKTEEDVTRLATAVGVLGLDMQQVVMTFANDSKMRLDQLGLSVEGVTQKAEELKAQGFQGDAFDEAVLIGLEERMVLLGDAAGTTAGEMAKLESNLANIADAGKIMMAERWQGIFFGINTAIGLASGEFPKFNQELDKFIFGMTNPIEMLKQMAFEMEGVGQGSQEWGRQFGEAAMIVADMQTIARNVTSDVVAEAESYDRALTNNVLVLQEQADAIDYTVFAHERYTDAAMMYASQAETNSTLTEQQANHFRYLAEQSDLAAEKQDELSAALAGTFKEYLALDDPVQAYNDLLGYTDDTLVKVSGRTADQEQALKDLRQEQERVQEQILSYQIGVRGVGLSEEERAEKISELNDRIGELNTAMEPLTAITNEYDVVAGNSTISQQALNEQLFAAISANSDNAAALAIAAGELGIYDEAQVEAALNAALLDEKVRQLASEWDGTKEGLADLRTELRMFVMDLEGIPSERTISFKLDIPPIPSELSGQPTGVRMTEQGPQIHAASGLDFTVPPGFPNDSFGPIFVQSGEHVKVTPAGETSSNSRGGGNTINVYAYPGMSANAIASAVNQQLVVGG